MSRCRLQQNGEIVKGGFDVDVINCKKKRNERMPYQCAICGNCRAVRKEERNTEKAENNKCYELLTVFGKPYVEKYQPFTNSKRTIDKTCKNFSHIRKMTVR
jgi:hypothetical protein